MVTQNEINSLKLSPTKKDFVQIWNELLEVAGKLSERWDPTSTNESDPGIVILKALTGIADRLNYNIDKNTLEAFMPTAAQEDSMRKLCDMLGYNIKYYQSARTEATIKYHNSEPSSEELAALDASNSTSGLVIPKFTVLTNSDQDVNYFTLDACTISLDRPSTNVFCMEGQIVKCESINDNNIITANQISENNRFYLPEAQIAENGIFVYNVINGKILGMQGIIDGIKWEPVDNLNVQVQGARVYKFGFDSYEGRPYIEFPEDYSELFNDGIFIYYARTNGASGNIASKTLTKLELPTGEPYGSVSAESISVENLASATTGANIETIKQAYNNFKKTIGTFETLVTCRDYMNKIYSMTDSVGKPYVSNILVTDIRNDLNRAITICSCDDAGIFYKESPLLIGSKEKEGSKTTEIKTVEGELKLTFSEKSNPKPAGEPVIEKESDITSDPELVDTYTLDREVISEANKPVYSTTSRTQTINGIPVTTNWFLGSAEGFPLFGTDVVNDSRFKNDVIGEVSSTKANGDPSSYWLITQNNITFTSNWPVERILVPDTIIQTKEKTRTITNKITQTNVVTETLEYVKTDTVTETNTVEVENKYAIDHFDIVFYPFKSYNQIKNNVKDIRKVYDNSFSYNHKFSSDIVNLDDVKTSAHTFIRPRTADETPDKIGDIVSINNYLRLNATIATNSKITVEEGAIIIDKIKIALANAFNMRELDFGEEIPFDSIVEVIENADSRIKVASLNEPALYTTFSVLDNVDTGGNATIKEYAVASDWLTVADADKIGRFSYKNRDGSLVNTFDTETARKIYNKLAVRNILAGRVPLFNYNNTFKTSFSEGAYRVTEDIKLKDLPKDAKLPIPTSENPFTIYEDAGITYTGQYVDANNNKYTKTYTPEDYATNVITTVNNNIITDITTDCNISADNSGVISDVKLASGEFIKFKAPNLTTVKTYPAYVNYHLALNTDFASGSTRAAASAEASTLFDLLDEDRETWSEENPNIRWQKVLDYFGNLDARHGTKYKKTIPLKQTITKYSAASETTTDLCESVDNVSGQHVRDDSTGKCKYCGKTMLNPVQIGPITVDVGSTQPTENSIDKLFALLETSGCLKLTNNKFKARLEWSDAYGDAKPSGTGPDLEIILNLSNPFITDSSIISNISETLDAKINELASKVDSEGKPVLPTECAWTVNFDFEYVSFEPASLDEWSRFIKSKGKDLFGFAPIIDSGIILWRAFGEGYQKGKAILENSSKLLTFDSRDFGLLPSTRLRGIYIVENMGKDAQPAFIGNGVEYMLKPDEYLYIEYTPSSTTEDGSVQEAAAVTEILGPGTIIKPSGFESGLMDSSAYASLGNSKHKTVTFQTSLSTSEQIDMYSFGANEQVEVRELAQVELSKKAFNKANSAFKPDSTIYYYKNFNDCSELEDRDNLIRTYTLKDGEYIFYTDQSKAELAYFTTGTEVTLSGKIALATFDVIDLSTIFDLGLDAIPWQYLSFSGDESITFQEYQYVTLGPEDTLKHIKLLDNFEGLNGEWQFCDEVEYAIAGSTESQTLPEIDITLLPTIAKNAGILEDTESELTKKIGNGWKACSTLELDVASNNAQTLRNTEQVQTSITLISTSPSGGGTNELTIGPKKAGQPSLSFKTNLSCQTNSGKLNISDVYSNPDKVKGFEFKIFAQNEPAVVKTAPGKIVPCEYDSVTDLTKWSGESLRTKSSTELWNFVSLDKLKKDKDGKFDYALRLPISLLPNTYGVFCIYLDESDAETWIEVLPGTDHNDITFLNMSQKNINWDIAEAETNNPDKLYLRPGINCIRINKTSTIFIKTSDESKGTLFFDELKLVNCEQIEYSDPADVNKKRTKTTQGLNLTQLGYLSLKEGLTDTDILDSDMLNSLKKDAVDEALKSLATKDKNANQTFSQLYGELLETQPKLTVLVSKIKEAIAEVTKLLDIYQDDASLKELLAQYSQLLTELDKENSLIEALDNNKNIEASGQQLTTLLNSFATTEALQQQLLADLDALKLSITNNDVQFSTEAIIDDFKLAADTTVNPDLISDLRLASKKLINNQYNEQLTIIANSLEKVTSFEDRSKLLLALESLQSASSASRNEKLLSKVRQLVEATSADQINEQLATIYDEALEPKYASLAVSLTTLRNMLSTDNIKALVAELELAADESLDGEYFATLVQQLNDLLIATDTQLIKDIDTLIETVESKATSTSAAADTTILNKIKNIRESIAEQYESQLTKVLDEITGLLSSASSEYSIYTEMLQETQDSQVLKILEEISDITTTKNTLDDSVDAFGEETGFNIKTDYSKLPFSKEVVISVWSDYMKQALFEGVEQLYANNYSAINNLATVTDSSSLALPDIFYVKNGGINTARTILIKAANVEAFQSLFSQVKSLAQKSIQKTAYAGLINSLSSLIKIPSTIAVNASDKNNRNAIIYDLLTSWKAETNLTKKQQLLEELRVELDIACKINRDLISIIANLLCPSILLYENEDSDEFYENFANFLSKIKADLLMSSTPHSFIEQVKTQLTNISKNTDGLLLDYLDKQNLESFKTWLLSKNKTAYKKESVLSDDYINKLFNLRTELVIQNEVAIVRTLKLFEVLSIDIYAKHQYDSENKKYIWIDQDGNVVEEREGILLDKFGNKIKLKRDENGKWLNDLNQEVKLKDSNGNWLTVDNNFIILETEDLDNILEALLEEVSKLENTKELTADFKAAYSVLKTEEQLLNDIRALDVNRDFYYTAPIDSSLAIEFNESDSGLNTLMNPAINYDINNINNNFVISKLDIDYLDKGIQIARSSRLN